MSTTPQVMSPEDSQSPEPELQSILFSSYAYLHAKKPVWRIQVQGQIFRDMPLPFSKRLLLRGLQRALHLTSEQAQGAIFQSRISGFLATPEVGRKMRIEYSSDVFRIRQRSRRSGLFQGRIDVPITSLKEAYRNSIGQPPPVIQIRLEQASTVGSVFLAGRSGISVISDIDDTIKQTDVTSRSRMLARTFLEDFESIEGMAQLYQYWSTKGGLFHYVSSSPWQIYRPLEDFLVNHGFPSGSMHLKWFRLRDEVLWDPLESTCRHASLSIL